MRDRPDGAKLLRQARATLLEDLLPGLPEERRFEALMVANAMAIAARELADHEDREAERTALEGLVGKAGEDDVAQAVETLLQRLATLIRQGKRDGETEVHDLLLRNARERLALSNPKRLPSDPA